MRARDFSIRANLTLLILSASALAVLFASLAARGASADS
jgi:hypothetical protein